MIGCSIYLNEPPQTKQTFLEKAAASGMNTVFTSIHIPEDDQTKVQGRFRELALMTKAAGLALYADVTAAALKKIGVSLMEAEQLVEWGVTGVRIDDGIGPEGIAALSQEMNVALNASTLTNEAWQALQHFGANQSNLEAWHNFYPRPETGVDRDWFTERNRWLQSLGLQTAAFVPGDGIRRGPIHAGLPTLEDHRDKSPFAAALELWSSCCVDHVLVGDPDLSESAWRRFKAWQNGCVLLRARAYTDVSCVQLTHTSRPDPSRDCIRSVESRSSGFVPAPAHTVAREMGAITIDNHRYGRYGGELQIVRSPLPADEKVNVIGQIVKEDEALLPHIGPNQLFQIEWQ